jgi:hypothetical protein
MRVRKFSVPLLYNNKADNYGKEIHYGRGHLTL